MLRPGGRISLFEPINSLMFPESADRFWGYYVADVVDLASKVKATFKGLEDPATTTMTDFDDRDLVRPAAGAGFGRIHLETHIDIDPDSPTRAASLDVLLDSAPNPLAPMIGESVDMAVSGPDKDRFLAHLERALTDSRHVRCSAVAYLAATKPG